MPVSGTWRAEWRDVGVVAVASYVKVGARPSKTWPCSEWPVGRNAIEPRRERKLSEIRIRCARPANLPPLESSIGVRPSTPRNPPDKALTSQGIGRCADKRSEDASGAAVGTHDSGEASRRIANDVLCGISGGCDYPPARCDEGGLVATQMREYGPGGLWMTAAMVMASSST
jgi:hypothetical protein